LESLIVLNGIFTLIIDTVASIVAGVLLLRFWMQAARVRPPMSLAQFIYQLSDWLVKPLRRVLPGVGGYDWASLLGAFLIVLASVALNFLIAGVLLPAVLPIALLRLLKWMLYGLSGLIIIEVIFSWVNPYAPLAPFVRALTEPLLRPFRRVIPLIGNIDFSPMVALLLFQIILQSVIPQLAIRLVGFQLMWMV
jgi:YggT family protein